MGTHPIFESDFDCLTDKFRTQSVPLFTTIKRIQESSDGPFFTEENTRRVSVKKLLSRDVSDVTSRHQKPSLVFLSQSSWQRSNKSQRSVKSNVITPSRPLRKRERLLKPTRPLPARLCQRSKTRHKPRCQKPQK